jgi:hypothetical protein
MLTSDRLANYFFDGYLSWDGSFLGYFDESIYIVSCKRYEIITLQMPHLTTTIACKMQKGKDAFPIIVDNLKNVFGLTRRGTHCIMINHQLYTLFYVPTIVKNGYLEVVNETSLSVCKSMIYNNHELIDTVQQYLFFHDLFGINCRGLSNIVFIGDDSKILINSKPEKMTPTIRKKLFNPLKLTGIGVAVHQKVLNSCDFTVLSNLFSTPEIYHEIILVIGKIDKNYLWLADHLSSQMAKWI